MFTSSHLLTYSTTLYLLGALERTGALSALIDARSHGMSPRELSDQLSLTESILVPICEFLAVNVPEILTKRNDRYYITSTFLESSWMNALHFALAYEPVFSELAPMLQGEKQYGQDICRDGSHLRVSSAIYNEHAWSTIIDLLHKMAFKVVVDCGCSAGDFLFRVSDEFPHMKGLGVDIDKSIIATAKKKASAHHGDRLAFINGDVADPDIWHSYIPAFDPSHLVIVGITVWHEFLYSGEEKFVSIVERYRSLFPGSTFIVVEYNGVDWKDMTMLPEPLRQAASVYQLVHPLTKQGMPQSPENWQTLFQKTGLTIKQEVFVAPNSTIFVTML